MRTALSLLFGSLIGFAQPRMSAPVAGYVFDGAAGSIRAVLGVPGAASAGDQLALNDSLSRAFLHPSLRLAAAVGKDGNLTAASWTGARVQQLAITPRFGTPDRIVFASNSDKALLLCAAGIELWSGLAGGSPALVYARPASALGGAPRNASLSDDGALAAVALDSGQIVEASQDLLRATGFEGKSAIYLSTDLIILGADGTLTQVRPSGASVLARGVDADADLAVANGFNGVVALGNQRVVVIDAASGELTRVDCGGCKPIHPQALSTSGMLYFEDDERGGLLLDIASLRIVPVAGIDGRRNQ